MTIIEQYETAEQMQKFFVRWGLKQKYVAKKCDIPPTIFSGFMHGKVALSPNQITRVENFVDEYIRRNS